MTEIGGTLAGDSPTFARNTNLDGTYRSVAETHARDVNLSSVTHEARFTGRKEKRAVARDDGGSS